MAEETYYNDAPNLDEIVFENRNKAYGAYDLRTNYPKILTKAFIIGTLLFIVFVLTPFIVTKIRDMNRDKKVSDHKLVEVLQEDKIFEQPKEKEPPPPPPPKEEPKVEIIQNVVPEPKKIVKIETPPPPLSDQLEKNVGTQNQEGDQKKEYTPPKIETPKSDALPTKPPVDPNEVYKDVDQEAEYPGGMKALVNFIKNSFDTSIFEGDEGKLSANVKFVVEKNGTVSDVRVVSSSKNKDFDEEAIKAVKKLKKWKPAKVNGQEVRSYYSVPISMVFEEF